MAQPGTSARAGKPLTAKGLATRARIVEAAAELTFTHGAAQVAIADVQREAGVSGSQMYHYFTDRDELIRAVAAYRASTVVAHQREAGLDSLPAIRHWAQLMVEHVEHDGGAGGCRLGSLVPQLAEVDPDARRCLSEGFEGWLGAIEQGLVAMAERGDLVEGADPRRLATLLLAALEGGVLLAQAQRDATLLRVALDVAVEHLATWTRPAR